MTPETYSSIADELVTRIRRLIPEHPQILALNSPFDLHKIDGFKCDDLSPSLAQASWALAKAKQLGAIS
jgi:hypothetical protein